MPEIFITLEEAAELEEMSYQTFVVKKHRNPELFKTKIEKSETGGKDRVMVALSSLSEKAKKNHKRKQQEDIRRVLDTLKPSDGEEETAWYVGVDLGWYMKKYRDKFLKAVETVRLVEKYLEYDDGGKTDYTDEFAKKHLNMTGRNFRRLVDRYRRGMAAAMEMNEYDGQNYDFYKILALCPTPRNRKAEVFTDEMKVLVENLWADKRYQVNQQCQTELHKAFVKLAKEKGWEPIPSYPTVNRYIKHLRGKYADVQFFLQNGSREFRRKRMLKRLRNTARLQVLELVQGDAHTFDCWVKVVRPNGQVNAIKPVLVGLIDTRSRCLVGWAICEVPNAQIIKQVIYNMIYPRKNTPIHGVPKVLLIDNGRDWTAKVLTGRPRTERFDTDEATRGFYKAVGIEYDKRSLPYQGWSKSQIERLYGTICTVFTKRLDSYVGTLTGTKTSGKIKKDIKKMLERDELLTIEEFTAAFERYINEEYHLGEHGGLKDQKEPSPIPLDVFMKAERYLKAAPPVEVSRLLLMECQERKVTGVGVQVLGKTFQHELLGPYIDQWVDIRYSLSDYEILHVYEKDGTKICEVRYEDGLDILARQGDERLEKHIREQNRQQRTVRGKAEYLATPFEERAQLKAERMVLLPELSDEKQQVVSLPEDQKHRNMMKSSKKKAAARDERNEYFDKQYEKAMAKLANL